MATKVELRNLVESVGRGITPAIRSLRQDPELFSDVTGFHVYGELNLTLRLTAARDARDAQRLLRILQEYTLIAEACAAETAAVLLEVQGERIHLLLPAAQVDTNNVAELLKFSIAMTQAVYDRIGKTAGKDFGGYKMAADHGRAILVGSGDQPTGSLVSLGPAANAPAKELKKRGVAAHLRMRSKHLAYLLQPPNSREWVDVPVLEPSEALASLASGELTKRMIAKGGQFIREALPQDPIVRFADANFLRDFSGDSVREAIKVQGFALRADLDGFSRQVEAAFARNEEAAIAALVQRFINIMRYPKQFRARMAKTIDLPWAGDCATVIVLPDQSGYEDAREFLPVKAASEWHSQKAGTDPNKRRWSEHVGEAKWAIGVAGGDDKEGSNGYVLIAPLAGRNRDFVVGAGWGVGRSLDAQESDGVSGDDTVIHKTDYAALDSSNRSTFRALNSIFWISHGLTSDTLKAGGIAALAAENPIYVPNVARPVPKSRPWSYGSPGIS